MISKTEWVNCIIEAVKNGITEEELETLTKAIYIIFKYMPDDKQNTCTDRPIFHEVVFEDRESAEKILEKMRYSVNLWGSISINEYYKLTSVDEMQMMSLFMREYKFRKAATRLSCHKNGVPRKTGRYPWRS